ncbi:MAG: hypothetical protein KME08_16750 [Aphanothece sp. CMT-3BRIN-NPC111]|jgi:hypothetical protein|nr:hypothetical protein [Aphanothece sp. CMT-3BRIN-NPC111]
MINNHIKLIKVTNATLILSFIIAIYTPLVSSILNVGVESEETFLSSELRLPHKFPKLTLIKSSPVKFIKEIQQYYNDRFAFRRLLIKGYSVPKVLWMGESSSPKVIVGKEGWLFLRTDGSYNEMDYYRSTNPYTPEQLANWQRTLEERNNRLSSQGIRYLLVIAPNKTTIYPEFLPKSINRVRQESRLDQLIAYLRANSNVEILDLRDSLRSAKAKELVYARRDTHWNDLGAFVAYQEIIKRLAIWYPNLEVSSRSDFELKVSYGNADLINMVGLSNIVKDENWELIPRTPRLAHRIDAGIHNPELPKLLQPFATELKKSILPRAVMFHDSFAVRLSPFLSEHFERIAYLWQDFDLEIVNKEHPDLVIQEMVERSLMSPIAR